MIDRLSESRFIMLVYGVVFAIGLFIALPALSYYWFGDDLHLVRPYSNQELVEGLTGNYAPEGIGNPGWRPITRLFYHAEAVLFGETVELYRLLAIALFALHTAILMKVARELKLSRMTVLVAAVILVCTKNTWWMLTWPTDGGLRAIMGIFGSLAIYLLILHLKQPKWWKFALSLLFYALALLTRDEILFYAAVIPVVAFVFLLQRDDIIGQPRRWLSVPGIKTVLLSGVMIIAVTGLYWVARNQFVPAASIALALEGLLFHIIIVLFPHLPTPTIITSIVLIVAFWLIIVVLLRAIDTRARLIAFFWLGCVIVACTPGLNAWRGNNVMLPIGFFALFVATIFVTFAGRSRAARRFVAVVLGIFILGSAYMHRVAQESLHPNSLEYIRLADQYLWGKFTLVEVPPERIEHLWAQYHSLGIYTPEDYAVIIPQLYAEAAREGRYRPDGDKPFIPVYASYLHAW